MIESFNEFLKKSGYSQVFERNYMEDVEVGFTEDDFKKGEGVFDNYIKIGRASCRERV